ncbi:hypothetical protein [Crassaminicella profunda]|uniref:hypothetical protein n=1 Tax=Crassaminicella profunda TaxID=1286698 RepID=UPI001CA726C2|nr:hypothetical protein [Crassaminicella profunda]QZY54148.1 hypothetical protein K7H06_13975 [Crassaminicella profunda]
MLEELNNILDRTNNWIVFEEARNSGLIALNLGLISFVFDSLLSGKKILLILCVISIMISAYSFIGKKLLIFFFQKSNRKKEEKKNDLEKLTNNSEDEEEKQEKKDALFTDSRVVIRRNTDNKRNHVLEKQDLAQYTSKNIYNYEDMAEIDEETLLLLVYQKLLKRNEKEEYPININKDYQFKLAHRDLSKMIHQNSRTCVVKSKCFFISLGLFIVNMVLLGILFLIH